MLQGQDQEENSYRKCMEKDLEKVKVQEKDMMEDRKVITEQEG